MWQPGMYTRHAVSCATAKFQQLQSVGTTRNDAVTLTVKKEGPYCPFRWKRCRFESHHCTAERKTITTSTLCNGV